MIELAAEPTPRECMWLTALNRVTFSVTGQSSARPREAGQWRLASRRGAPAWSALKSDR